MTTESHAPAWSLGLREHLRVSLRLHFRNRLALIYGYVFPLLFLAAFRVLYRHESVPLAAHVGELLTITILGGACFGLPTTLVSERERGVWRRYRLTPMPTWTLVVSAAVARYLLLLTAGLLQLAAAGALGMPLPVHAAGLVVAFTAVSFAFIGLGLVLATLADNVPAVQALGQCIFLPMLVLGGVAVPVASLPRWAQHVAAFFPGRYAVEALQACATADGLASARLPLVALALIGGAAVVAGTRLFRWDAQQRFLASPGRAWLIAAFAGWVAAGALAESTGHIAPPTAVAGAEWTRITPADTAALDFSHLPPDDSVVTPIASETEEPNADVAARLETLARRLPAWPPGNAPDAVQAVRNVLGLCAVVDVAQRPEERFVPLVALAFLRERYAQPKLVQALTWIAGHPDEGTMITDASALGLDAAAKDEEELRQRVQLYAIKFIARLTGRGRP